MMKEEKEMLLKGLSQVLENPSQIEDIMKLLEQIEKWKKCQRIEKQKEGISKARAKGVPLGRPMIQVPDNFNKILISWNAGELTAQAAARMCGIGVSTFYRRARAIFTDYGNRSKGNGDEKNEKSERK